MYCKHCGGPLELTDAKCRNCGAGIDFLDGGQSFFEDSDLQEWGNRTMPLTPIPKTESREEEKNVSVNLSRPHKAENAGTNGMGKAMDKISWLKKKITNTGTEKKKPRNKHGKKKKTRIVNPNRLITVCIAFALVLVLIVVAIWKIVEISSGDKNTGDMPSPSATEQTESAGTDEESADTDNSEKSSDASDNSEETSDDENVSEKEADDESVPEEKSDVKAEEDANRVTDAIMNIFGQKQ